MVWLLLMTMRARSSFMIAVGALVLAGCAGSAPQTFDLSAAKVAPLAGMRGQLAIREPRASLNVDSNRIVVRTGADSLAYLGGAQWSDRLPALFQAKLVQTFENAHLIKSVSRSGDGISADYVLEVEIRAFELDSDRRTAVIDLAVRKLAAASGKVVGAKLIHVEQPAAGDSGADAASALDAALSSAFTQIVQFAVRG
jgi:cholesterol transport system auxiliary component